MQSIKAKLGIGVDRKLTIQLPDNLPKGKYEVVLTFGDPKASSAQGEQRSQASFIYAAPPDEQFELSDF